MEADGQVSGQYVSDQTGREYEVFGKVESPKHKIQFTVRFPQSLALLSKKSVKAAARAYFNTKNFVQVTLYPEKR